MSRLGEWAPTSLDERVDRLEADASIHQLAHRYALALDARDLDSLVDLFVPDVRVGAEQTGHAALRAWFDDSMRKVRTTVHLVASHVIEFAAADRATGIVYCRDEVEYPDGAWHVGVLQYWDTYRRVDATWCFEWRKFHRWYQVDALQRPSAGAGVNDGDDPIRTARLPDAFPTWQQFWHEAS